MARPNGKCSPRNPSAFTLIEILVVIGIIVVLMGILIPAIGAARERGYHVKSTALLAGLANNIETYFTTFDAYPGPIASNAVGGISTTGVGGSTKLSGTQSLLVALTYSMYDPAPAAGTISNYNGKTLSGTTVVDIGNTTGPRDLSQTPPKAFPAFFNPNPKDIGAPVGITGGNTDIPTIYDQWPDALPILYFRRTPSTEGSVAYDASYAVTPPGSQTVVSEDPSAGIRPYYRAENKEYFDSTTLKSITGRIYDQSNSRFTPAGATANENLAGAIAGRGASQTFNARGGFVLMSAGSDRIYGPNKAKNDKNDDIIMVPGH